MNDRPDRKVVDEFLNYLRLFMEFEDECPDKQIRDKKAIDCMLWNIKFRENIGRCSLNNSSKINRILIEHTKIDTFPNQEYSNKLMDELFSEITEELNNQKLNARYFVEIKYDQIVKRKKSNKPKCIIPYHKKQQAKQEFKTWIQDCIDDRKLKFLRKSFNFDDEIELEFKKEELSERNLPATFHIIRMYQNEHNIDEFLTSKLVKKIDKLNKDKIEGDITCLLVESNDSVNMSEAIVGNLFNSSCENNLNKSVDLVFYADSKLTPISFTKLKDYTDTMMTSNSSSLFLIKELQSDFNHCLKEIKTLIQYHAMFENLMSIINENEEILNSELSQYFKLTYVPYAVMCIRRLIEKKDSVFSLFNLLSGIRKKLEFVSYDNFRRLYPNSRNDDWVKSDFILALGGEEKNYDNKFSAEEYETTIKEAMERFDQSLNDDIRCLNKIRDKFKIIANKMIAHSDRKRPENESCYNDIQSAIDEFKRIILAYHLLLTGQAPLDDGIICSSFSDISKYFKKPWIITD